MNRRWLTGGVHRGVLKVWELLPFPLRWAAVRVIYLRAPVGAVAIIRDESGRVLCVRQAYARDETWGLPGGWLNRSERPADAAVREVFEELGLRVRAGHILATGMGSYGEVRLAYACAVLDAAAIQRNAEIDEARYFAPDALPPLSASLRLLIEEALER